MVRAVDGDAHRAVETISIVTVVAAGRVVVAQMEVGEEELQRIAIGEAERAGEGLLTVEVLEALVVEAVASSLGAGAVVAVEVGALGVAPT